MMYKVVKEFVSTAHARVALYFLNGPVVLWETHRSKKASEGEGRGDGANAEMMYLAAMR